MVATTTKMTTTHSFSGGRSRPFGHVLPVKVIQQGNDNQHTISVRRDSRLDTVGVALAFVRSCRYYLFGERCSCRCYEHERQSTWRLSRWNNGTVRLVHCAVVTAGWLVSAPRCFFVGGGLWEGRDGVK